MDAETTARLRAAIEHTALKPEFDHRSIENLCREAIEHQFFGVCIHSCYTQYAKRILRVSEVKLVNVVGFPLGACASKVKAFETEFCINSGADEIDTVISIGSLKEKNFAFVESDIREVVRAAGERPVKVILETALLKEEEKRAACQISEQAGASFVKTCTGFLGGGATVEDIKLMRETCSSRLRIKASGGIKSQSFALSLLAAGADRLGTSSGVQLILGEKSLGSY